MPASLPARPLTQPYRFRKICRTGFSLEKPEERPTAGSAGNQIAKFFQIQINSLTLNTEKGALFRLLFLCCKRRRLFLQPASVSHACFLLSVQISKNSEGDDASLLFRLYRFFPQHFLYFLPLPHGHGSFLPIFGSFTTVLERR